MYDGAVRCAAIFAVGLSLCLAPAPVGAQETSEPTEDAPYNEEARALYRVGTMAFNDGRYEEALGHYRRSHELSGRVELLYNIATTLDRLRRDAEAVEHFERFLAEAPDSPRASAVRARIAILRGATDAPGPAPPVEPVPPPAEVAAAAEPAPVAATTPSRSQGIATRWWFWTILGVVVVAAAVGVGVAVAGADTVQGPPDGVSPILETLRGAP